MTAFMRLLLGHNPSEAQLTVSEHALTAFSDLGCTSLRKLVIMSPRAPINANVTEEVICSHSALKSLACGEVTIRALRHLSQFPSLNRLTIGLGDNVPTALTFTRSPFCRLRYLTINTKSVGPCLSLLKAANWNIRCFHHRMDVAFKRLWGIEDDERELINECISQSLVVGLFVVNIYLINECI